MIKTHSQAFIGAFLLAIPASGLMAEPIEDTRAASDTVRVSLEQAIRRGFAQSEEIRLARSQIAEARAQVRQVRADLFPQLNGELSYVRTLRSPFSVSAGAGPSTPRFDPDPTAPLGDRIRYIEQNAGLAATDALSDLFTDFPIGQENTWIARITVRQTLFDGSVFAGLGAAKAFVNVADAQATEQEAQLALDITRAYYNAVLADQMVAITNATAELLDAQLAQVQLIFAAGNAADLDVLRVQVERQNLEPQRVAALNARDVALLDLKRLTNIPAATPLILTDELSTDGFRAVDDRTIDGLIAGATARRASIAAAEGQVELMERQVQAARAEYLPTVSLTAGFGKQALPSGFFPSGSDFGDDWTVGVAVQVPIFSGLRRKAGVDAARQQLTRARLNLDQTTETVSLDIERQIGELRRASALIAARAQTTVQAARVYELASLAYDQGVATNLDLQDARVDLSDARANEAQALHDYYLAFAGLLRAAGSLTPITVALDTDSQRTGTVGDTSSPRDGIHP